VAAFLSWALFVLGIGHVLYGAAKFRGPLLAGFSAGVVGQFSAPETRRTAFWFVMFGPLLMLAGQVAIHAVAKDDLPLLRLVGTYLLAVSVVGVAALPRSPFVVALLLSALLLAAGYAAL
jgi:hypothetical protein